jgi:hypothetical protein
MRWFSDWWRDWRRGYTDDDLRSMRIKLMGPYKPGSFLYCTTPELRASAAILDEDPRFGAQL